MKILCLYNNKCAIDLFEWLREIGHDIVLWSEKLDGRWCREQRFDLAVSYTYRYLLSGDILDALGNNAVNIHNAYLPWNRGADPNIWSLLEDTPRGCTIHYMNSGLDKGDIIVQQLVVDVRDNETLASAYKRLDETAKQLFKDAFMHYNAWQGMRKQPVGKGSFHRISDADAVRKLFDSFDILVSDLKSRYQEYQSSMIGGGQKDKRVKLLWLPVYRWSMQYGR